MMQMFVISTEMGSDSGLDDSDDHMRATQGDADGVKQGLGRSLLR